MAAVATLWKLMELYEQECHRLLEAYKLLKEAGAKLRFPLLAAYELVLKCSHLFNLLDARGSLSVTERVSVIGRVRTMACGLAAAYLDQQQLSRTLVNTPSDVAMGGEKESTALAS